MKWLEKLEKIAKLVLEDLSHHDSSTAIILHDDLVAKVKDLMNIAFKALPDHEDLFTTTYHNIRDYGIEVVYYLLR